jgi:hypothetical protein
MKFIINGELPSLNEYIQAERSNRFKASSMKKKATELVFWECRRQKLDVLTKPITITYTWYMKNKKKDLDNVEFAKKFINDGLVLAGIIINDGQEWVRGFTDKFKIDRNSPRVEVVLTNTR